MDAGTITYEAYEDTLIIHMPRSWITTTAGN